MLSTQLKNCFIIGNRICSYYNLLELGNRVSHVYMQFEYHKNTVVSNYKYVPPVSIQEKTSNKYNFHDYKTPVKEEKYPGLLLQPHQSPISHPLLTHNEHTLVKSEPPDPHRMFATRESERVTTMQVEFADAPLNPPHSPPESLPEEMEKDLHAEHAKEHSDIKMSEEEEYAIMNILELTKSPQI